MNVHTRFRECVKRLGGFLASATALGVTANYLKQISSGRRWPSVKLQVLLETVGGPSPEDWARARAASIRGGVRITLPRGRR